MFQELFTEHAVIYVIETFYLKTVLIKKVH